MSKSKYPRHDFWGAGEPDCPKDLKAPNGELCDMRCKVCGDGWRDSGDVCIAALGPPVPRYSGWLWTHVVKGGEYRMLGEARLQTDKPLSDMTEVVVYQGADGKLWAREKHEYEARFSRTRTDPSGVPSAPVRLGEHNGGDYDMRHQTHDAGVPVAPEPEVTDAMVDAYLKANDAYWKRTDELPKPPGKWRTGTPREATRESLRAALGVEETK